jgi:hypothetical protein
MGLSEEGNTASTLDVSNRRIVKPEGTVPERVRQLSLAVWEGAEKRGMAQGRNTRQQRGVRGRGVTNSNGVASFVQTDCRGPIYSVGFRNEYGLTKHPIDDA